jgi:DNA polymerase elongation subunit (family B)
MDDSKTGIKILSALLRKEPVFLTESIEVNGRFAFIVNTPDGDTFAVHPPTLERSVVVRFLHMDPRQIRFQQEIIKITCSDALILLVNDTIQALCKYQPPRPQSAPQSAEAQGESGCDGGGDPLNPLNPLNPLKILDDTYEAETVNQVKFLLDLLPLRDCLTHILEDAQKEPFKLCWRHIDPPFVSEVWPSQIVTDAVEDLGQHFLKLDQAEGISYQKIRARPNLNYFSKDIDWLQVHFRTKAAYYNFLKPFKPKQPFAKGLRPQFFARRNLKRAWETFRVDVFHSEIRAENNFLASKGLKLYSGCRLVGPRLVSDSDETKSRFDNKGSFKNNNNNNSQHNSNNNSGSFNKGKPKNKAYKRTGKISRCKVEFTVDDIIPVPEHIVDRSSLCYYHVSKINNNLEAHTIACIFNKGFMTSSELLVFTTETYDSYDSYGSVPDLQSELSSVFARFPNFSLKIVPQAGETAMIKAFFDAVLQYDVDILVSLDGLANQMAFLAKRLSANNQAMPNCSRVDDGVSPEINSRKSESIHAGDKNYDWLNIFGRAQVDIMNCARDLKLAISNGFRVFDALLQKSSKLEPGFELMRKIHGDELGDLRLKDLDGTKVQRKKPELPIQEAAWTAVFCWLAEQDKKLILDLKQISAISNTPLMALEFQGEFVRVINLLHLNTFPKWVEGQGDVQSHSLLNHQVDLLRENWVGALDPDEQARRQAKQNRENKAAEGENGEEEITMEDMLGDADNKNNKLRAKLKRKTPNSGPCEELTATGSAQQQQHQQHQHQQQKHVQMIRVQGGNVEKPKPGFYHGPIILFDFWGLYPSIIRIGFDFAVMVRSRAEATALQKILGQGSILHQNAVNVDNCNYALFFVVDPDFDSKYKLVMESCTKLTDRREELKEKIALALQQGDEFRSDLFKSQEQATKKMNNSVYGIMRLIYPAFAGAITWKGRNSQQHMKLFMCGLAPMWTGDTKPLGFPITGDTDSIMTMSRVLTPKMRQLMEIEDPASEKDASAWARHDELVATGDADTDLFPLFCECPIVRAGYFKFATFLAKEFSKSCRFPMRLEVDGIMGNFLTLAMKNYTALIYKSADAKPKLKQQGVASIKRDRANCVRKCFAAMSERICQERDLKGALSVFSQTVKAIKTGDVLFSDLFITREVTAKARRKSNNLTTKVIKEVEKKTKKSVKNNSTRLVYVAVTRDGKSRTDMFQDFRLALQGAVSSINKGFYLDELVNVISSAFGTIFGKSVFHALATDQRTLPGQITGNSVMLAGKPKKNNESKKTAKRTSSKKGGKKTKTQPAGQSNTLLAVFKPSGFSKKH